MKRSITGIGGIALGLAIILHGTVAHAQQAEPTDVVVVVPDPAPPVAPNITVVAPPAEPVVVLAPAPEPAPQRRVTTTHTRRNTLLLTGLLTFGVTYGASVVYAANSDHTGDDRLYVPVLGPWLAMNERDNCTPVTSESCDSSTTANVLLAADGVFQGLGVVVTTVGLFTRGSHTERTTTYTRGYHITPASLGRGTPGIRIFGTF